MISPTPYASAEERALRFTSASAVLAAIVLAAVILAPPAAPLPAQDGMPPRKLLDVDGGRGGLAVADFNGDHRADLAVASFGTPQVVVFLNDGAANLVRASTIATGSSPYRVAAADLDGDGHKDLVTASASSQSLTVAYGDGSGGFSEALEVPTRVSPRELATGDLDGDGLEDLVLGSIVTMVLRSLPGRSFAEPVLLTGGVGNVHRVVIGDYNGDEIPDVAAWARSERPPFVFIHEGDGAGGFTSVPVDDPALDPGGPFDSLSMASGDFDGDGDNDLVLYSVKELSTERRLRGSFRRLRRSEARYTTESWGPSLPSQGWLTLTADLDAIGPPEILVFGTRLSGGAAWVVQGSASESSPGGACAIRLAAQPETNSIIGAGAGDFDGDGRDDVAVLLPSLAKVELLLSPLEECANEARCYEPGPPFEREGSSPALIAVDDFREENASRGEVIFVAEGRGRWLSLTEMGWEELAVFDTPVATGDLAVGDLDLDGRRDIVLTDAAEGNIETFYLDRSETFLKAAGGLAAGLLPHGVIVDDVDGDGTPDVAVTLSGEDRVAVFIGQGDRTFSEALYFKVGRAPKALVSGDVDGDGNKDLIVTNAGERTLSVLRGTGERGARLLEPLPGMLEPIPDPQELALSDLDGNGRDDIVVTSLTRSRLFIYRSFAEGYRASSVDLLADSYPTALLIEDLDGDRRPEIVTANSGAGTISILEANERDEYELTQDLPLSAASGNDVRLSLAIGDLDGDGHAELLAGHSGGVAVLRSLGCGEPADTIFLRGDPNGDGTVDLTDPVFILLHLFQSGEPPSCLKAADANDDGGVDLADAVFLLGSLFAGGGPLPPPREVCGVDPSADDLSCAAASACR